MIANRASKKAELGSRKTKPLVTKKIPKEVVTKKVPKEDINTETKSHLEIPKDGFKDFDLHRFLQVKKSLLEEFKSELTEKHEIDSEELEDLFDDALFEHSKEVTEVKFNLILMEKDATKLAAFWAIMDDMFKEVALQGDKEQKEIEKVLLQFYETITNTTKSSHITPEVLEKLLDASTDMEKQSYYNPDWINHNFINSATSVGIVEEYNSESMLILANSQRPSEDDASSLLGGEGASDDDSAC